MDGTHLAAGTVAGERSTHSDGGTRTEDLAEVGWSAEIDGGGCLKDIVSVIFYLYRFSFYINNLFHTLCISEEKHEVTRNGCGMSFEDGLLLAVRISYNAHN